MEACGTAHYWGRRCQARGHRVRLLPVQYVQPYVRRNKTDRTDTDALLEAARCEGIQPVPVKTREQQALQALHRVRTQWQDDSDGALNDVRGLLREHGIADRGGRPYRVEQACPLHSRGRGHAAPGHVRHAVALRVRGSPGPRDPREGPRSSSSRASPRRIRSPNASSRFPASACSPPPRSSAAVAHIHAFRRARQFASWLGLTPRDRSSGFRRHLGRISKRGDVYLRCLLTHGARAVLLTAQRTRARQRPG